MATQRRLAASTTQRQTRSMTRREKALRQGDSEGRIARVAYEWTRHLMTSLDPALRELIKRRAIQRMNWAREQRRQLQLRGLSVDGRGGKGCSGAGTPTSGELDID